VCGALLGEASDQQHGVRWLPPVGGKGNANARLYDHIGCADYWICDDDTFVGALCMSRRRGVGLHQPGYGSADQSYPRLATCWLFNVQHTLLVMGRHTAH